LKKVAQRLNSYYASTESMCGEEIANKALVRLSFIKNVVLIQTAVFF